MLGPVELNDAEIDLLLGALADRSAALEARLSRRAGDPPASTRGLRLALRATQALLVKLDTAAASLCDCPDCAGRARVFTCDAVH